jgi:hypothetical protein
MKQYMIMAVLLLLVTLMAAQNDLAARIGERSYSKSELEQGFAAYLEYQNLPAELSDADSLALYERYFDELIAMYIYDQAIAEKGIHLSPSELQTEITRNPPAGVQTIPELLTDGRFDQKKYEQALQERPEFKLSIMEYSRDIYEYRKLLDRIKAEASIDVDSIKAKWLAQEQSADAEIIYFDYTKLDIGEVAEDEIRELYQERKAEYRRENGRSLYYVRFAGASSRESAGRLDEIQAQSEQLYEAAQSSGLQDAALELGLPLQESQMFSADDSLIRGIGRQPGLISKAFTHPIGTVFEPLHSPMGDIFVCEIANNAEEYYIPFEVERGTLEIWLKSAKRQAAMQDYVHDFIRKHRSTEYLQSARDEGLMVIRQQGIKADSHIETIGRVEALNRTILSTPEGEFTPLIEHNGFFYLAYVQKRHRRSEQAWLQQKDAILEQARHKAQQQYLDDWYLQQKASLDIQYPKGLASAQK